MDNTSVYKELGRERKKLQKAGEVPVWVTTPSWQTLKAKYLDEGETLRQRFQAIAHAAAQHMAPETEKWYQEFYKILWNGWLSCSTPVLANMGKHPFKGCPVSCSGSYIGDSVYDFYDNRLESAILSQQGFGTSGYLGDIRERGSPISRGGFADGAVPVFAGHRAMARDISQGSTRRGSWAGYLPIDHPDFWELGSFVLNNPDDSNIGWNVSSDFTTKLNEGDSDALARYQRSLKNKMVMGKGYYFFPDKVNALNPPMYDVHGLSVKASNLCTEICLHSDEDHTYTCVLSSMNLAKYDEWKDTDAVFVATVFLDCVAQEFIEIGKEIRGLEKAVRFTERGRSLGLGALGYHTYLQLHNIPFDSLEAAAVNNGIFKHIRNESNRASRWMAISLGEPEWCRGFGVRNTHTMAVAPNLSSALICGSVSQGIEPVYGNVYEQSTPSGNINRINPVLIKIMKDRGVFNYDTTDAILKDKGSVRNVTWLSEEEKKVFRTAFEIDQFAIIRMAAQRQKHIDQAQSINLFFGADEDEEVISAVHQEAFENPYIKSLYYIRSQAGVVGSTGECESCAG